jgi:3-oxoadipate enol-lactonase
MGGWIAFQFAVDCPEMVRSLVIVNSWADMRPKSLKEFWQIFQRIVLFQFFSMRKIGEVLSRRLFIKLEQEEHRRTFVERWGENHKPSYMAAMRSAIGWSVSNRLGGISAPTLMIAADEDYTSVESKRAFVEKMPNAELVVIEDSRHATPVERPEEFNRVVLEFYRKLGD